MRHELTNDADEISMPRLPGISSVNLRRFYACAICFMALVLIVLLCNWAINLYTDYLWFNKLGRSDVFTKILLFKVILFTSCFIISGACLVWNIRWAFNNARGAILLRLHDDVRRLLITIIGSIVALGVVVSVAVLAIVSANNWETFILLVHQLPFGLADPQFGLDVTFYIVTLKALNFIQDHQFVFKPGKVGFRVQQLAAVPWAFQIQVHATAALLAEDFRQCGLAHLSCAQQGHGWKLSQMFKDGFV